MRTAIFSLLTATSCRNHPSQLAGAIALGVAAGLLPKFSGMFVLMLAIAFAVPVHLLLTLAVAGVVSLIAASFSSSFASLGQASLTHPLLTDFWLRLDTYPLVPWLRLHNTLVHGTAVVATAQLIPTLMLSRLVLHWLAPVSLRRTRIDAILRAKTRETDSTHSNMPTAPAMASSLPLPIVVPEDSDSENSLVAVPQFQAIDAALAESAEFESLVEDANLDLACEQENAIDRIEQILAEVEGDHHSDGASSDAVLRRAARLVSAVDDILNVIDAENELEAEHALKAEHALEADRPTSRVEDELVSEGAAIDSVASPGNSYGNRDMLRTDDPLVKNEYRPLRSNTTSDTTNSATPTGSATEEASTSAISVRTRFEQRRISREGEVLRNLLHHLRDLKEKV